MNQDERISLLKNIIQELDKINEYYIPEYPGHHMLFMARSFINSVLLIESSYQKITPIRNHLGMKK